MDEQTTTQPMDDAAATPAEDTAVETCPECGAEVVDGKCECPEEDTVETPEVSMDDTEEDEPEMDNDEDDEEMM